MATVKEIGNAIRNRRMERIERLAATMTEEQKPVFLEGMLLGAFTAGQSYGAATIVDCVLASEDIPVPDPLKAQA